MVAAAAAAAAAEEEEEEASRGDNGKQREATAAHSNIQHTGDGKSPNSYRGKKKANGSRQPVHQGVPHTHVTWLHDTLNQLPPSATRTNPQYYRGEATNIRRQPRPTHLSTSSGTQSITDNHHHSKYGQSRNGEWKPFPHGVASMEYHRAYTYAYTRQQAMSTERTSPMSH